MRWWAAVLVQVVVGAAVLGAAPAHADPVPTTLTLAGPSSAYVDTPAALQATLQAGGSPVPGVEVQLERLVDAAWTVVDTATTDADGQVGWSVQATLGTSSYRAEFTGTALAGPSTSTPITVRGVKIATTLTIAGPSYVIDERSVVLRIRWHAVDGRAVTGPVALQMRVAGTSGWRTVRTVHVQDGTASVSVRPRVDTVWRVVGVAGPWYRGASSAPLPIDNRPPGLPVVLPAAAPAPRITLPPQPRATGAGLNAAATRIPGGVWRSMVGRTWHSGCPVGRGRLRLIRMNYWGFDGYRHRGELVVNVAIVTKTVSAFRRVYAARLPIRAMYREDRFGWSKRLHGANDYRSMSADNTSAFNCRQVVGRPGFLSPHASGRAIDVNTWENPYASGQDGWVPDHWWVHRSNPRVAWRSGSHPFVRAMRAAGFRWTYGTRDSQHFDG